MCPFSILFLHAIHLLAKWVAGMEVAAVLPSGSANRGASYMARRRSKRRRSLDEAMRWSLDMGKAGRRRRDLKPPVKKSQPPPKGFFTRGVWLMIKKQGQGPQGTGLTHLAVSSRLHLPHKVILVDEVPLRPLLPDDEPTPQSERVEEHGSAEERLPLVGRPLEAFQLL